MGERFLTEEEPKAENVYPSNVSLKKLVDKALVHTVFQFGKKVVSDHLVLFFLHDASSHPSYAIYIKKSYGRAVERNRAKRVLRASLYQIKGILSGYQVIITPRKKMKLLDYWQLVDELQQIFCNNTLPRES